MISSISTHSVQQLHSSPSNSISSQSGIQAEEKEETQQISPAINNDQKVNATVNGQESQASKKDSQQDETQSKKAVKGNSPTELNEEELKEVQKLKQRDIEVRAHEAAHLAAAGQHAQGGAKFTLKKGPDGKSYAIGGSVSIDTSKEADPEATIRKADQIKRAALAPAEPSGQDRSVAAEAAKMKLEAQAELAEVRRNEAQEAAQPESNKSETEPDSEQNAVDNSPPSTYASALTSDSESDTNDKSEAIEAKSEVENIKSAAKLLCEICSGDHPTGPHLEANQQKTSQYTAISQA